MPGRIVRAVPPDPEAAKLLPGAQFLDAFRTMIDDPALTARTAAERGMGQSPAWLDTLMAIRNAVATPFGLKTPRPGGEGAIGIFPVIAEAADHLVVGLDDKHLDFRAILELTPDGRRRALTVTTIVRTHNLLGRTYLATIMPFHRVAARSMVRRAAGG